MFASRGGSRREDVVLIVDDDRPTADSLMAVLSDSGLEAEVAPDTSTAKAAVRELHPAAVIVDQQLAGDSGELVALELKQQDPLASVMLLTSATSLERVLEAAGRLDGLLVKPLIPQIFVQTVRNALSTRTLMEEIRRLRSDLERHGGGQEPESTVAVDIDPERFRSRLAGTLAASQSSGNPVALLLVELGAWGTMLQDGGEGAAEEVILAASERLSSSTRKTDLVGRVAENRFAVACCDVDSPASCRRVVKTVLDGLDAPFTSNGANRWLAPTAGAVLSDPSCPEQSPDMLLGEAQTALSCALDEGRSWRIYEKSMGDEVLSRSDVSEKLREALNEGELSLVYRPLIELRAGRVVGATAHVRWPGHGDELVSSEFLAAEGDLALSAALNAWVLDTAFADLARWRDEQRLAEGFTLTLDVSSREVGDPQFTEELEELLVKHRIDATMIGIDLSEHAARQAVAAGAFARLSALGVSFSLDDVGAGRTQLTWMRDLPIEAIKIDSLLVEALDTTDDSRGTALVRGLIALGRELHVTVVAKGVRTAAQRSALLAMGCDLAEQVNFGRPGPSAHDWQAEPAPADVAQPSGFSERRARLEIVNPEDDDGQKRT